jgi:hypothetical protein
LSIFPFWMNSIPEEKERITVKLIED